MNCIAAEIRFVHGRVLNVGGLVIVCRLVSHHMEVDGVVPKYVGLSHAEHLHAGEATFSSVSNNNDMSAKLMQC